MQQEKLTEVLVSYFFRADDYTVVMETSRMKYGAKKIQRRVTEIVNYMVKYGAKKIQRRATKTVNHMVP